jgi:hypothetical protein
MLVSLERGLERSEGDALRGAYRGVDEGDTDGDSDGGAVAHLRVGAATQSHVGCRERLPRKRLGGPSLCLRPRLGAFSGARYRGGRVWSRGSPEGRWKARGACPDGEGGRVLKGGAVLDGSAARSGALESARGGGELWGHLDGIDGHCEEGARGHRGSARRVRTSPPGRVLGLVRAKQRCRELSRDRESRTRC